MKIFARRNFWLFFSLATIAVCVAVIAIIKPTWGIDFVGGSLMEIPANQSSRADITALLKDQFGLTSSIQTTQDGTLNIRMASIDEAKHQEILQALQDKGYITGEELRFESIGPTIGQELRRKSVTAITFVVIIMIVYLRYTFRRASGLVTPWKFGVAAVYALVHDLLVVTALFVVFGKIWGAPIDTLFVTAQLAILGYSVNDTIVIFNRVKLDWITKRGSSLEDTIEHAVKETLSRSLNTSFTTLLVLVALLLFGGSTIRWFIAALAAGTIVGTYSSILVAPPLLAYLARRK